VKPETLNSPLFTNDGNPVRLSDLVFEKTVTITCMSDKLEVAVVSSRKALEFMRNSSMSPTTD
jgi:hypothetical protein